MGNEKPKEPMHVHGMHVFYRGESYFMARSLADTFRMIPDFVWEHDCFNTDRDPIYLFCDFHLINSFHPVRIEKYRDKTGRQHERRVVEMRDHEDKPTKTFNYTRPIES